MEKITSSQLLDRYKKLDAPHSESQLKKIERVSGQFKQDLALSNKSMSEALPIIDIYKLIVPEYMQLFHWIEERYNRFIFKGARGSVKTTICVQYILISMMLDPQANWFAIMENKVQHSDTTMLDFKHWIDVIDLLWIGFAKKWEKSDGQSIKEWRYKHNGNYQKIKFIGLDEAGKGTISPPAGGYWKGFWVEEVQASDEQFGANMEQKEKKFDVLNTLKASCIRFFNRCKDLEKQKTLKFLELYSFNPYNDEDPILKEFNEFHPDNEEELMTYGFSFKKNRDRDEVYITSNYLVNPHLPEEFVRLMERTARLKIGAWRTICYGFTGSPINTVYSNIYHLTDKLQEKTPHLLKSKSYTGFKNFMIAIDIGNGGKGETTIGLLGKKLSNQWVALEEWGSKEYEDRYGYEADKIIHLLWKEIKKWKEHYVDWSKMKSIPIVMDYDSNFQSLFDKGYDKSIGTKFRSIMFKEKYKTSWKNERRPAVVRNLITTGQLELFKEFTPKTYSQWRSTKADKNGKVMDGNDDFRQMLEMGLFHIAKEVGTFRLNTGKLVDKDMINFMRNNV